MERLRRLWLGEKKGYGQFMVNHLTIGYQSPNEESGQFDVLSNYDGEEELLPVKKQNK